MSGMRCIRLSGTPGQPCPEWAIIELQGEIAVTGLSKQNLTVGNMRLSATVSCLQCAAQLWTRSRFG